MFCFLNALFIWEPNSLANESAVPGDDAALKLKHEEFQQESANPYGLPPSEVNLWQALKHDLRYCAQFRVSKKEESS